MTIGCKGLCRVTSPLMHALGRETFAILGINWEFVRKIIFILLFICKGEMHGSIKIVSSVFWLAHTLPFPHMGISKTVYLLSQNWVENYHHVSGINHLNVKFVLSHIIQYGIIWQKIHMLFHQKKVILNQTQISTETMQWMMTTLSVLCVGSSYSAMLQL